jgi:glycosyltransferase involved in cell wall biosynthesis
MKILNFANNDITDPQDGLPEYLRYFANILGDKGHEIIFINVRPNVQHETEEVIEYMTVKNDVYQVLVNVPEFYNEDAIEITKYIDMYRATTGVLDWNPDLIIMHDWMFAPILKSFDFDAPTIYFNHLFHNGFNVITKQMPTSLRLEELGMNECADWVVTNSKAMEDEISQMFPQLQTKTYSVKLGVDKEKYLPSPNLEGDTILFLGRLDDQKGIEQFLDEVEERKEDIKNAGLRVVVAGAGKYLSKVCDMHFAGTIEYLGVVKGDDKMKAINDAKYMVFPSVYEPWGLSLNEGLACGKICIVSPVGGHREQVKNNKNGRIVNSGEYIKAILELEKNPGFQKKLSCHAIKLARDIREHFKELGRLLNDLLGIK